MKIETNAVLSITEPATSNIERKAALGIMEAMYSSNIRINAVLNIESESKLPLILNGM